MLERFHILYRSKSGTYSQTEYLSSKESDVPCNEVLSYYVRRMDLRPALFDLLSRRGDLSGTAPRGRRREAVRYPMFWADPTIYVYLAQHYIINDNMNNVRNYTYDDFFKLRMFTGEIYKTQNLRNMSLVQLYPTPEAQDSARKVIEGQLQQFDRSLWVAGECETATVQAPKSKTEEQKP